MLKTQQLFNWGPLKLTSDREHTIAKAIHQWHEKQAYHYGPRSDIDRPKKGMRSKSHGEIEVAMRLRVGRLPQGNRLRPLPGEFIEWSADAEAEIIAATPKGNAGKHFRALYKACEQKMVTRRVSEGCTSAGAESQFIPR